MPPPVVLNNEVSDGRGVERRVSCGALGLENVLQKLVDVGQRPGQGRQHVENLRGVVSFQQLLAYKNVC